MQLLLFMFILNYFIFRRDIDVDYLRNNFFSIHFYRWMVMIPVIIPLIPYQFYEFDNYAITNIYTFVIEFSVSFSTLFIIFDMGRNLFKIKHPEIYYKNHFFIMSITAMIELLISSMIMHYLIGLEELVFIIGSERYWFGAYVILIVPMFYIQVYIDQVNKRGITIFPWLSIFERVFWFYVITEGLWFLLPATLLIRWIVLRFPKGKHLYHCFFTEVMLNLVTVLAVLFYVALFYYGYYEVFSY